MHRAQQKQLLGVNFVMQPILVFLIKALVCPYWRAKAQLSQDNPYNFQSRAGV